MVEIGYFGKVLPRADYSDHHYGHRFEGYLLKEESAASLLRDNEHNIFGLILVRTDYSDRHYSQTVRHLLIIVDVLGERHCPLAKFFFFPTSA